MASPDKTPQPGFPPYSELAAEVVRLRQERDNLHRTWKATERELSEERAVVERLREAIDRAEYELHPNQGEPSNPVKASLWLRSTFPPDHPNFVASPDKPPEANA